MAEHGAHWEMALPRQECRQLARAVGIEVLRQDDRRRKVDGEICDQIEERLHPTGRRPNDDQFGDRLLPCPRSPASYGMQCKREHRQSIAYSCAGLARELAPALDAQWRTVSRDRVRPESHRWAVSWQFFRS